LVCVELVFFATFFLGDPRVDFVVVFVVFGDFGDLAFGDSTVFFGDLAFATFAFLGDVASFFGLEVVVFLVVEVEAFFTTFLGDEVVVLDFVAVVFLGDLAVVVDDFFELDVDLFFGDEGAVEVVVVVVVFFTTGVGFFLSLFTDPGVSL